MKSYYWLIILLVINTGAFAVNYEAIINAGGDRRTTNSYIQTDSLGQSVIGIAENTNYKLIIGFHSIIEGKLPCLPDPEISKVEPEYQEVCADGKSKAKITITLLCSNGTPVPNKKVKLYSDREKIDIIEQPTNLTDETGQTYGYVKSYTKGTAIIYAEDITDNIQLEETVQINFIEELKISNLINYPNPAAINQTSVKFRYELSKQAQVKIRIFNTNFELIHTIEKYIPEKGTNTGENIIEWFGINKYGEKISAGIYFYIIEAIDTSGNKTIQKGKIVIVK